MRHYQFERRRDSAALRGSRSAGALDHRNLAGVMRRPDRTDLDGVMLLFMVPSAHGDCDRSPTVVEFIQGATVRRAQSKPLRGRSAKTVQDRTIHLP